MVLDWVGVQCLLEQLDCPDQISVVSHLIIVILQ